MKLARLRDAEGLYLYPRCKNIVSVQTDRKPLRVGILKNAIEKISPEKRNAYGPCGRLSAVWG